MTYPSLEDYQQALQHPQLALIDPVFKTASIARTGLGQPLALCGGFALTYAVTTVGRKFAVRCFHKQASRLEDQYRLEERYRAISHRLGVLSSPYFVDFEFQPRGVRVGRSDFPIVKMAWASGVTLGEFLSTRHRDKDALGRLDVALQNLAAYLEANGVAHGDVQPGNVMVADDGKSVQLIDYDGMYVEQLRALGSAELGLRNFQHPLRTAQSWDAGLDRFSFITIAVAIRALTVDPGLWSRHQADETSLLFKANDFAQPEHSAVFRELSARPELVAAAKDFAAICGAPYEKSPTPADFVARRNIPPVAIGSRPKVAADPARYLSAFPVFPADYARCLRAVGDRIELVAKVTDVKHGTGINAQPYVFINFGDWRGSIVKIAIWSDGLRAMTNPPDRSWVGQWVAVVGLLEPPYSRGTYHHLTVTVTQANQLHLISEKEAAFRLAGSATRSVASGSRTDNTAVLEAFHGNGGSTRPRSAPPPPASVSRPIGGTPNAEILAKMRQGQSRQTTTPRQGSGPSGRRPIGQSGSQPHVPTSTQRSSSEDWKRAVAILAGIAIVLAAVVLLNSPLR